MRAKERLTQGEVLGNRYRIVRTIGAGGMSCVYMAEDLKLSGKVWAIKETAVQHSRLIDLRREASLLISLTHARLPRVTDFFEDMDSGYVYLVMDFIEGVTLEEHLRSSGAEVHRDDRIRSFALQLLDVLQYLHSHQPTVIYRDLKPSNIMITPGYELKCIDFGIARNYREGYEEDTVKLGTIGFAAPEQYGGGQTDERSDLYSLGALLLYMASSGKYSEWRPEVDREIQSLVPGELLTIIRKLLRYSPAERYQTAQEVIADIQFSMSGGEWKDSHRNKGGGHSSTRVVAVLGTAAGCGVTHTAIAISHFLERNGYLVALAEMNEGTRAFDQIRGLMEGEAKSIQQDRGNRSFSLEGVHYWRRTSRADVIALLGGTYEWIVLDMGHLSNMYSLEEFQRADFPIIVAPGAEWRVADLIHFVQTLPCEPQARWSYCLPLASQEVASRVGRDLKTRRMFALPLHLDPFGPNVDMERELSKLIHGSMPARKKRFRFLLRR
ncbi:Serine/threonine-protein kinase PrkC [compost metagenome]